MKKLIFITISLLIAFPSWATSTIDLIVGDYGLMFHFDDSKHELVDIYFCSNDNREYISANNMEIIVFNVEEKRMEIKYNAVSKSNFPPAFYININDNKGKIIIGGKSYTEFEIDWTI